LRFGAVPEASLWFSKVRQVTRFKLIVDVLEQTQLASNFSISDIGCGYGALIPYLIKRFPDKNFLYTGFEIAEKPLNFCKERYNEANFSFKIGNIPDKSCDFSVMSGTYNYAPIQSPKAWENYLFENLSQIWNASRCGIVFNLSVADEAKITSQNISYFSKRNVKNFCHNNLGKTFLFMSDKLPKEATFFISRT
jgi:SAM-dependent methyltransferase